MSKDQSEIVETLRGALASIDSWLERWGQHVGNCSGDATCTCGLTRMRYEATTALIAYEEQQG